MPRFFALAQEAKSAETKTHSGLIGAFGRHLVKTGCLSAELGRALNEVERVRLLADYTGDKISYGQVNWVVEHATTFIAAIQREVASQEMAGNPDFEAETS